MICSRGKTSADVAKHYAKASQAQYGHAGAGWSGPRCLGRSVKHRVAPALFILSPTSAGAVVVLQVAQVDSADNDIACR